MIKIDQYPVSLTFDEAILNEAPSLSNIESLKDILNSNNFNILFEFYETNDGFIDNEYDNETMISLWPINKIIEYYELNHILCIGDYFVGADLICLDTSNPPHCVFLAESESLVSPSLEYFFSRWNPGHGSVN